MYYENMVALFLTFAAKEQPEGKVCVYGVSCRKSRLVFPNKNYPVRWLFATAVVLIKLGISLEREKKKERCFVLCAGIKDSLSVRERMMKTFHQFSEAAVDA